MDKQPSCPELPVPALYLSPPALPVVIAKPIDYEYIIFIRQCFCYSHSFTLTKRIDRWKVRIADREKAYQIPVDKSINDINLILQSLGINSTALYKLEIWCGEKNISTKYFTSLHSIIKNVSDNEIVIAGVSYGSL